MTIVAPVAIALMVGVVDFGMGFSARATLGKSARDAARYLAGLPQSAYCQSWAEASAKNLAVYGNTAGTGNPVISGWSVSGVSITPVPATSCPAAGSTIVVTASYSYSSIILAGAIPGYLPALPSTFNWSAQHQEVQVGGS